MHCKNGNSGNEENCKNFNINLSKIKTNEQEIKEDKNETRDQARSNEDSLLNTEYCDNIAAGSTADVRDSSSVQNISNPGGRRNYFPYLPLNPSEFLVLKAHSHSNISLILRFDYR